MKNSLKPVVRNIKSNRKLALACGVVSILIIGSLSFLLLNKNSNNVPFTPDAKLVASLSLNPKECCAQVKDFSISKAGYVIASNDGLAAFNDNNYITWSVQTNKADEQYKAVAATDNAVFAVRRVFNYKSGSGPFSISDNSTSFLEKFDNSGKKIWQFELPKAISVNSLLVSSGNQVYVNAVFENTVQFSGNQLASQGKTDVLKLTISTENDEAKIVEYKHIGSAGEDGIFSNQNDYSSEDILHLDGPVKISWGDKWSDFKPKQSKNLTINTNEGNYYCYCNTLGGGPDGDEPYLWLRATSGVIGWRGIASSYTQHKNTYLLVGREIAVTSSTSDNDNEDPNADKPYNFFIEKYTDARLTGSKLINPEPEESSDNSSDGIFNNKEYPALSATKDKVALAYDVTGKGVTVTVYDESLKELKTVTLPSDSNQIQNIKGYGGKFYIAVYNSPSSASIYQIN